MNDLSDRDPHESEDTGIDAVCADFKTAVEAGEDVTIADCLQRVAPGDRDALQRALESIEAAHRQQPSSEPIPPDSKAPTLRQFIKKLAESGLMSHAEIDAFRSSLPAAERPETAQDLAKALYRHRQLTRFQTQAVFQGKTKGLVLGNYVVLDKIGQGGMGHVYKALHRRMKRQVAVKILPSRVSRDHEAVERFRREVVVAAGLTHPNIVTAYDADEADGIHFLVMEFVDGTDLSRLVRRKGVVSVRQAIDYAKQAATGLQYAHEHGVIHRDIKPSNLLLDRSGTVKILDMGLARFEREMHESAAAQSLTQSGQVMGTLDYMAPEQALDIRHADARADIYSLGCTLCFLLTGEVVFGGDTMASKIAAHRKQPVPSLRLKRSNVSESLDRIFQRMLEKRPEDRQESMDEVILDLQACYDSIDELGHSASLDLASIGADSTAQHSTAVGEMTVAPVPPPLQRDSGDSLTGNWLQGELPESPTLFQASKSAETSGVSWQMLLGGLTVVATVIVSALLVVFMLGGPEDSPSARVREAASSSPVPEHEPGKVSAQSDVQVPAGTPAQPSAVAVAASPTVTASPPLAAATTDQQDGTPPAPAVAPFDAIQATQYQQSWADYLGLPVVRELALSPAVSMKFVLIPPGEFLMGSTQEEIENTMIRIRNTSADEWTLRHIPSEAPQHRVRITESFYLGQYEVTVAQFRTFVEATGYVSDAEKDGKGGWGKDFDTGQWVQRPELNWRNPGIDQTDQHPVVQVSWNDALAFCRWLGAQAHDRCSLPTEAQWEYACRAGTTSQWCFGENEEDYPRYGWFGGGGRNREASTAEVGERLPNNFKLFDVHGNAWEWCLDRFGADYYGVSPTDDPKGPKVGRFRVNRGGSWLNNSEGCRSADRRGCSPGDRRPYLSFRTALALAE